MAEIFGEYVEAVKLNDVKHALKDKDLTERVDEIETDVDEAQGNINSLQSDVQGLQNNVQNLRGTLETAQEDISDLQDDVDTAQTDISTLQGNVSTAQSDIQTMQGNINTIQGDISTLQGNVSTAQSDIQTAQGDIDGINDLIPNQASAQNQLADKNFVNSSIATNTANFLGTYSTLAEIEAIPNPTNNDYAFLETTDQAGNTLYDRYKYSASDSEWLFEYEINNSGFTAEQWATINSGLTQQSVEADIDSAIGDLDVASVGGNGEYIESISEADGKIVAIKKAISSLVASGDNKPVSSDAVYQALQGAGVSIVDTVESGNMSAVTSNAVANYKPAEASHADLADYATGATNADRATTATNANYATSAGSASSATNATNASYATRAGNVTSGTGILYNSGISVGTYSYSLVDSHYCMLTMYLYSQATPENPVYFDIPFARSGDPYYANNVGVYSSPTRVDIMYGRYAIMIYRTA